MSPKAQLLEFLTQNMESAFSRRQSEETVISDCIRESGTARLGI